MLVGLFQPYVHSSLWLLVMIGLLLLGVWLLTLAWRRREDGEGLSYVFAVFAALPLLGAGIISVVEDVDLWKGLAGLAFSIMLVFSRSPRRRRRFHRF